MALFTRDGVHRPGPQLQSHFFLAHGHTEAPLLLQCWITLRCGYACPHCLASPVADAQPPDMPLDLFDRLCGEAAQMGVREMLLTGGEPLAHPAFGDIVNTLRRYGLNWSINTAVNPSRDQQSFIAAHPPGYAAVSLDGPRDLHNAFRGSPGAFDSALAALRFFASLPATAVGAGTTITTLNLPHLEETFQIVRQSGASRWGIHLLLPEGRAARRKDLFPSRHQLKQVLAMIALKRRSFPVALCDELGFAGEWEPYVRDEGFFCAAGRAMCAVLPDGSLMPCSTLDHRHAEGNLNRTPLKTLWAEGFARQRRPRLPARCSKCRDQFLCGSGCWLQREHGTACFRSIWKMPAVLKAAAGLAACAGAAGIAAGGSETNPPIPVSAQPLVIKGIYASKAGPRLPNTEQLTQEALAWLATSQNADGSWGSDERKALLTSLAALSFLSQGETPSSNSHGQTVQKALLLLVPLATDHERVSADPRIRAALTWCLAEAYGLTQIPLLREALMKMPRLSGEDPLPWRLFAAYSLRENGALPDFDQAAFLALCPPVEGQPTNQVERLTAFATLAASGRYKEAAPLLTSLEPNLDWKNTRQPFFHAYLLQRAFFWKGGRLYVEWNRLFLQEVAKTRLTRDSSGWWTPASLGLTACSETEAFTESDSAPYATAWMILCQPPLRNLPVYRPPQDASEKAPVTFSDDFIIQFD